MHEVDFKQLKIENKQYIEKIDEKNAEMIKLKKMVGMVTQTLNYRKVSANYYLESFKIKTFNPYLILDSAEPIHERV